MGEASSYWRLLSTIRFRQFSCVLEWSLLIGEYTRFLYTGYDAMYFGRQITAFRRTKLYDITSQNILILIATAGFVALTTRHLRGRLVGIVCACGLKPRSFLIATAVRTSGLTFNMCSIVHPYRSVTIYLFHYFLRRQDLRGEKCTVHETCASSLSAMFVLNNFRSENSELRSRHGHKFV
jgi:hypothetical protein